MIRIGGGSGYEDFCNGFLRDSGDILARGWGSFISIQIDDWGSNLSETFECLRYSLPVILCLYSLHCFHIPHMKGFRYPDPESDPD